MKDLFDLENQPSCTNRRFYPKMRDIRNHIYVATVKLRLSKIDQVNVEKKICEWKKQCPSSYFFFRKYADSEKNKTTTMVPNAKEEEHDNTEDVKVTHESSSGRLLLVYQTSWQRRLLSRYGNELCLLDATYKTTRYSLPLFFLAVKSNVDYQVAGLFVVQDETTDAIQEALGILSTWNPTWKPAYFMVDKCDEEISAIESTFKGNYFTKLK